MKLTILEQEWNEGNQFPNNCDWKKKQTMTFRKYTQMSEYLEAHPELQNKVMVVRNSNQVLGNKVIYDGLIFVENYGHI